MSDSVNLTEQNVPDWHAHAAALMVAGEQTAAEAFGHRAEAQRLRNLLAGYQEQVEVLTRANSTQREIIESLQSAMRGYIETLDEVGRTIRDYTLETDEGKEYAHFGKLRPGIYDQLFDFDKEKELQDCGCGSDAG